jgi:hypothetical protein
MCANEFAYGSVRVTPLALSLTLPLLRPPSRAVDSKAPATAQREATARLVSTPAYAALLAHALDSASRLALRHAEPATYTSLAGTETTVSAVPIDFAYDAVLRGMRRQVTSVRLCVRDLV